jgi:tRNA A37 N6-isopentenylltransferase MiaA
MHLRGELTVDEAAQLIKHETHRLVRHQYTWFKRSKLAPLIHWVEAGPSALDEAKSLVQQFLNQRSFPSI